MPISVLVLYSINDGDTTVKPCSESHLQRLFVIMLQIKTSISNYKINVYCASHSAVQPKSEIIITT